MAKKPKPDLFQHDIVRYRRSAIVGNTLSDSVFAPLLADEPYIRALNIGYRKYGAEVVHKDETIVFDAPFDQYGFSRHTLTALRYAQKLEFSFMADSIKGRHRLANYVSTNDEFYPTNTAGTAFSLSGLRCTVTSVKTVPHPFIFSGSVAFDHYAGIPLNFHIQNGTLTRIANSSLESPMFVGIENLRTSIKYKNPCLRLPYDTAYYRFFTAMGPLARISTRNLPVAEIYHPFHTSSWNNPQYPAPINFSSISGDINKLKAYMVHHIGKCPDLFRVDAKFWTERAEEFIGMNALISLEAVARRFQGGGYLGVERLIS